MTGMQEPPMGSALIQVQHLRKSAMHMHSNLEQPVSWSRLFNNGCAPETKRSSPVYSSVNDAKQACEIDLTCEAVFGKCVRGDSFVLCGANYGPVRQNGNNCVHMIERPPTTTPVATTTTIALTTTAAPTTTNVLTTTVEPITSAATSEPTTAAATPVRKVGVGESPGDTATLDEEGYQQVLATGCQLNMELYVRRLITSLNLEICNDYGVLGLVPWFASDFSSQNAVNQNFAILRKVLLDNVPPAECAFVAPAGSTCPPLGSSCKGPYLPASHRRRYCQ